MAWEWGSVITSMFSHGGLLHLFGNMLFLYLYGDNLEDAMGKIRYFLFYLFCGFFAAIAQSLIDPSSEIPMVGASGAISGVIAGYLLLVPACEHPRILLDFSICGHDVLTGISGSRIVGI